MFLCLISLENLAFSMPILRIGMLCTHVSFQTFACFLVYDTVESGRMRGIRSCMIG